MITYEMKTIKILEDKLDDREGPRVTSKMSQTMERTYINIKKYKQTLPFKNRSPSSPADLEEAKQTGCQERTRGSGCLYPKVAWIL